MQFNSTLPTTIEVLKKIDSLRYSLKVGNLELETKSQLELEIGSRHWAELKSGKFGNVIISSLKKQPDIMKFEELFFNIEEKKLDKEKLFSNIKGAILERLENAETKREFLFFTNLLLSLNAGVITIPFKERNKKSLLQVRKSKKDDKKVEFYSLFSNLGPLDGEIFETNEDVIINIFSPYRSTLELLRKNIKELNYENVNFILKDSVTPFYDISFSLLNLRG